MFTLRFSARLPRSFALALAFGCVVFASTPAIGAASKTTKATGSSKSTTASSAKKSTSVAAKAIPAKTTLPTRLTPKNDLVGWDLLAETEWPKARDAVRAGAINPSIRVHQSPDELSPALSMQRGKSAYGAIAFLALGRQGDFVRVLMPLRPNGTVGWVKASDVTLDRVAYRITIEVDTNTLSVESNDGVIVSTKVALGTNNTPTPTGLFYVREIVPQANPNGGLGPVALGLSGLSEELRSFGGGFGRIGIHGTNAPGKLGGDVSHGCVRMDNPTITKLAKLLPLGTPVEILRTRSDQKPDTRRLSSIWIDQTVVAPSDVKGLPVLSVVDGTVAPTIGEAVTVPSTTGLASGSPTTTPPTATSTLAPSSTIAA